MKPVLLLFVLFLAGCNLAPKYHSPAITLPVNYKEAPGWAAAEPSDAVARGEWWRLFNDPVLNELESKVIVTNQNVASYRAAYQAARALVITQRATLFPLISLTGSRSRSTPFVGSSSGSGGFVSGAGGALSASSNYMFGIGASWEPDLWGKLSNAVSQAEAGEAASEGDLINAALSAQGELAANYIQLRGIDAQRTLLDQIIQDYRRALSIASNKYEVGVVARSDVFQAQTSLSNALALRQDLDRQRAVLEHAIAVLTGENPSTFTLTPEAWQPVVPDVPATLPATLLQRRPDIAAAERRVAAANANIGIQRAAYFPQVTLTAGVRTTTSVMDQLFKASTGLWSFGLSGVETLLDFGARRGQVLQAKALFDQTVALYRQTVLSAFQQVEDNLAATRVLADVTHSQKEAADAAAHAKTIINNQYLSGMVDYSQVIIAQTTALNAQQAQIQAVINQQAAAVALIQAIGGHWLPVLDIDKKSPHNDVSNLF
ncbi:RND transporter [Nitrosomonas sp. HPC101]|uniref:efflux transporter outer membrane subunit n=1 Tax=Nitrosomonas sp. HPC101 TaxID=1658667 RepID=UPI001370F1BD|nr:efflux transporter outer membrane subunit [Nitrosomonas sp. HPC101]MXS86277.1 RND transporter [Nitrosomonas sp. HPC101]